MIKPLENTVSTPSYSEKNLIPARIVDVTYNNNEAQYIVIGTNYFGGNSERYFAIPVLPTFLEEDDNGKLIFNLEQDDLVLAKRVHFGNCPAIQENYYFSSIYEVYGTPNIASKRTAI